MPRKKSDQVTLLSESPEEDLDFQPPQAAQTQFQRKEKLSSADDFKDLCAHTFISKQLQTTDELVKSCAQFAEFINNAFNKKFFPSCQFALKDFLTFGHRLKSGAEEELVALEDTANFYDILPSNANRNEILEKNGIAERAITKVKERWGVPFVVDDRPAIAMAPIVASTVAGAAQGKQPQ